MNVRETLSVIKSTVYTQSADQTLAFKLSKHLHKFSGLTMKLDVVFSYSCHYHRHRLHLQIIFRHQNQKNRLSHNPNRNQLMAARRKYLQ